LNFATGDTGVNKFSPCKSGTIEPVHIIQLRRRVIGFTYGPTDLKVSVGKLKSYLRASLKTLLLIASTLRSSPEEKG
jgi:hypothetical protein